ncbi:histone H3.v1-like, partial [Camellia sinensis]|uniref:histone H3.v1-like n=1 Tax=Camellia sinensis TaxID=4442 RepID=UPI0010355FDF
MEVHLAIPPQDLLKVLDVPKPKGAGAATSSTVLTTSVPVFASIPRVTQATSKKGTSQGDSPQKIQAQQKKRRPLLEPEKEVFEVQAEEEEEEEEEEEAKEELTQEQKSPLKRRKRVAVPSSGLVQDPMHETMVRVEELTSEESESQTGEKGVEEEHSRPAQRKMRRNTTVSSSDFVGDPIHKAAAKMQDVRVIQIILPLPRSTLPALSLRPTIPALLSFGLTPHLSHLTFDFSQFTSLSSLAPPPPSKEIPTVTPSLMSSVSSTTTLSAPLMSNDEVDVFEARLASLFDIPSTSPAFDKEAEPLVLADSLLEIFESFSSSSSKPSVPLIDSDTCLELLNSFLRILFEALQRPIIRNGFLQCCKIVEQSSMN